MKQLIDFKNGIARQLQYEDWDDFVRTQQQFGKYPFREHDRAAEMYAKYRVAVTTKRNLPESKRPFISREEGAKIRKEHKK